MLVALAQPYISPHHSPRVLFWLFDRSPMPQIFSGSLLVILRRLWRDGCYFPAAGRRIYEGNLLDYLQNPPRRLVRAPVNVP